jgi:hypothetical protein
MADNAPGSLPRSAYFAGENRALDVAKLHEALPLTQGSTIAHEAIEEKWRKAVFQKHQIVIIAVRGVGFYVQPANAAVKTIERSFLGTQKRATRLVGQHNVLPTQELSQLEAAMYYHNNRFMQAMAAEIRKVVKVLANPKPQEQNPKRGQE